MGMASTAGGGGKGGATPISTPAQQPTLGQMPTLGGTGGKGGGQPAPAWQPAEGQDFGDRAALNRYLAERHNYTGDFSDGQWGDWSRANLSPMERAQNQQLMQAYDAGQWAPPQGGGPGLTEQVTGGYQDALQGIRDWTNFTPESLGSIDRSQYMNPYQQDVIDTTMQEMNRQYGLQQQGLGDQAIGAGAFGGDRHGIAQAEMARNQMDQSQRWLADLNNLNFQQATQQGMFDIGNQFQNKQLGMGGANQLAQLANMGFGWGTALQGMQRQAGMDQFNMQQALLDRAQQQWGAYTGQPYQNLQAWRGGMPSMSGMGGQTSSSTPGLMDYLGMGAKIASVIPWCWVAREVYGPDNPDWQRFRNWMLNDAPSWLRNLYGRHGERFAKTVRRRPWLKRILRPLMDSVL